MRPTFSIILPVHNGGTLVQACVRSILAQTVTDFELLVLDNASTDGTSAWIQSLNDPRISIFPSSHKLSMVDNWGRVKDVPKAEFMTLIGHDDLLEPNYLEIMQALIRKHPNASLYQTHYTLIDANGLPIRPCLPMDEVQTGYEFLACHMAQTMDSMGTGYLFRSRDYDALGGIPTHYPNLIFADYELWIRLSSISYKASSPQTGFQYRIHQSVSRQTNGEQYQEAFGQYVMFMSELAKQCTDTKRVVVRYGHQMLMYYCESLSHRLLKTPIGMRTLKVDDFIQKCTGYQKLLIPEQKFEPEQKFRIRVAGMLDRYALARTLFNALRPILLGKP